MKDIKMNEKLSEKQESVWQNPTNVRIIQKTRHVLSQIITAAVFR